MSNLWATVKDANARGLFQHSILPIKGRIWFVAPQVGADTNTGKDWSNALASMTPLDSLLDEYDVICLAGVLRQQWNCPSGLKEISVVGMANRARQATADSVPEGGGATWLAPSSPTATTPLVNVRGNGWRFYNIMFGPHTDDAGIKLNAGGGLESGHCLIEECHFSGGLIGVEDAGGTGFLHILRSRFYGHTGANGGGIVCTSTANAVPLRHHYRENLFAGNQSNILISLESSVVEFNRFGTTTAANINTAHNSGQGGNNHVIGNSFNIAADDFDPAGGVTGHSTDVWSNTLLNAIETGQPAN
jgi:hypothetical protein